jgi:hypothetical protein
MKKYKLLKEYPGSPELGTIVKELYYVYKGLKHSPMYDEYWEEVVEKDYEILSYLKKGSTTCTTTKRRGGESHKEFWNIYSVKRLSDGEVFTVGDKFTGYSSEGNTIRSFDLRDNILIVYTTNEGCITNTPGTGLFNSIKKVVEKDYQILKSCPIEGTIYSVERLSDGEVFTLGDRIKVYQHGSIKTIDSIDLYGNTSSIKEGIWFSYSTGSCHMTHIIKQKPQPIYLTHDGKDIFPEDIVWYVNKENFYHDYIKAYPEVKFNSDIRAYFLTEEEAKKYIIENKPALSINEFWEITWMSTSGFNKHTYMKNLVKERLNLK